MKTHVKHEQNMNNSEQKLFQSHQIMCYLKKKLHLFSKTFFKTVIKVLQITQLL